MHMRMTFLALAIFVADQSAWAQSFTFTTLAGKARVQGTVDGKGAEARLHAPTGITVKDGTVYFNEYWNSAVRKVTADGTVTTLAGVAATPGSADGAGAEARFFHSHGITIDRVGTLFATDYGNNTIRKITTAGIVTTVAGLAGAPGSADGTGSAARFSHPESLAVDAKGTLYVADTQNYIIRKITPTGVVTTFAGQTGTPGSADGKGAAARFDVPIGLTIDGRGNLYVVDGGFDAGKGNSTVRKIAPDGTVTTLAGLAGAVGSADGKGAAARFHYPVGITVDKTGTLFIADTGNFTIRQITPDGVVTTVAGTPGARGSADGTGPDARFDQSQSITVDGDGTLYVADTNNSTIRKGVRVAPAGAARPKGKDKR